jgi:hypothetical protein
VPRDSGFKSVSVWCGTDFQNVLQTISNVLARWKLQLSGAWPLFWIPPFSQFSNSSSNAACYMSDVNSPCASCGDEDAVLLIVKRALIMLSFLGIYCVLLCCFTCNFVDRQQSPAEVEMALKEDDVRNRILALMFPGQQVRGTDKSMPLLAWQES